MSKRITTEERQAVLQMLARGEDRDTIAATVGVTPGQVSAIAAHVTMGTYTLPNLQAVIDTALYASERVGSVVPMLFTPVPGSIMFRQHKDYLFAQQAADGEAWDLHDLNGKLLPFLEYNRKSYPWLRASDYLNLESLMMHLNSSKVRQRTFNFAGPSSVARGFRRALTSSFEQAASYGQKRSNRGDNFRAKPARVEPVAA